MTTNINEVGPAEAISDESPFALAQQAADVAYNMTLESTGDKAKAADDYKAVMTGYYVSDAKQPTYDRDFYAGIIAARRADPHQHDACQVSIDDMMIAAGRNYDWLCHLCCLWQPGWAGDCLTCEQHGMMGDRD